MASYRLTAIFFIFIPFLIASCGAAVIDSSSMLSDTPTLTSTTSLPPTPTATASLASSQAPPPITSTVTPSPVPATVTASPITAEPASTSQPVPACGVTPEGVFFSIWENISDFRTALGCPTSAHPRIEPAAWEVETAYQPFEQGAMVWSNKIGWYAQPVIYVLYTNGTFQRYEDTFDRATDPIVGEAAPHEGLYEPILGFGKIWREQTDVREALGWATAEEVPGAGRFQIFLGGAMIWLSQRGETYVFFDDHGYCYAIVDSPKFYLREDWRGARKPPAFSWRSPPR